MMFTSSLSFDGVVAKSVGSYPYEGRRGNVTLFNVFRPQVATTTYYMIRNDSLDVQMNFYSPNADVTNGISTEGREAVQNVTVKIPKLSYGVWVILWWLQYGGPHFNPKYNMYLRAAALIQVYKPDGTYITAREPMYEECAPSPRVALGSFELAYMHNETMLDVFLGTLAPVDFSAWMCAKVIDGSWTWECGPKQGATFRETGFTNWAPGEPNPNIPNGCLVVDVTGKWYAQNCSLMVNNCFQFFTPYSSVVGYVTVNVDRPDVTPLPTFNISRSTPRIETNVTSRTQVVPLFNSAVVFPSPDADWTPSGIDLEMQIVSAPNSGITLCMNQTDTKTTSSCCEPIVLVDSMKGSSVQYRNEGGSVIRHVALPGTVSLDNALRSGIVLSSCLVNGKIKFNVSWRITYVDRLYFPEYQMYLTSSPCSSDFGPSSDGGRQSKCQEGFSTGGGYRSRVALAKQRNVKAFVRSSGLEGWTCGRRDSGSTQWFFDCGYDGEEGTPMSEFPPPHPTIGNELLQQDVCEYVSTDGKTSAKPCNTTCTSPTPPRLLCWYEPLPFSFGTIDHVLDSYDPSASSHTTGQSSSNSNAFSFWKAIIVTGAITASKSVFTQSVYVRILMPGQSKNVIELPWFLHPTQMNIGPCDRTAPHVGAIIGNLAIIFISYGAHYLYCVLRHKKVLSAGKFPNAFALRVAEYFRGIICLCCLTVSFYGCDTIWKVVSILILIGVVLEHGFRRLQTTRSLRRNDYDCVSSSWSRQHISVLCYGCLFSDLRYACLWYGHQLSLKELLVTAYFGAIIINDDEETLVSFLFGMQELMSLIVVVLLKPFRVVRSNIVEGLQHSIQVTAFICGMAHQFEGAVVLLGLSVIVLVIARVVSLGEKLISWRRKKRKK